MLKILEIFKDTKNLILLSITCLIVCMVGTYRNFGFVEIGSFKLTFDFMFFVVLVVFIISIVLLVWKMVYYFYIIHILKTCTQIEKEFLYNRVYDNGNNLKINIKSDSYFYIRENYQWCLYKKDFETKNAVIKFLRQLENKNIIKRLDDTTMIIPEFVWNVLIKKADKIFENYGSSVTKPTDDDIKKN